MSARTHFRIAVDGEKRQRFFVDHAEVDRDTYIQRHVKAHGHFPPELKEKAAPTTETDTPTAGDDQAPSGDASTDVTLTGEVTMSGDLEATKIPGGEPTPDPGTGDTDPTTQG